MTCLEAGPLLHARLDDELDMANSASVDRHLSECRACAAQFAELQSLHEEIAAADLAYVPRAAFERKLAARFREEERSPFRPFSMRWLNASVMAAAAIGVLALIVLIPARTVRETNGIAAQILDSHLRSLQEGRQLDVPSPDRHTVKPWFQGRTSFSPPVPDLTRDGFVLVGGRLEVIHQQRAAAIVYRLRQHVINLYVAPSTGANSEVELRQIGGYHMLRWRQNNLSYWAVSDVNAADLRAFANLIRAD